MQKQVQFNQRLTDALTDLDITVANTPDLNLINLEVLCIPQVSDDSCKAFLASNPCLTLPHKNAK
jgi:hypothetical protein